VTLKSVDDVKFFLNIFKKCHHHFEVEMCIEFLAFFLPAYVVSYLQIHQKRCTLNHQSFP